MLRSTVFSTTMAFTIDFASLELNINVCFGEELSEDMKDSVGIALDDALTGLAKTPEARRTVFALKEQDGEIAKATIRVRLREMVTDCIADALKRLEYSPEGISVTVQS